MKQEPVDFPDQPDRGWQLAQPIEAVVHGHNVVNDFIDILWRIWREDVRLGSKEVLQ